MSILPRTPSSSSSFDFDTLVHSTEQQDKTTLQKVCEMVLYYPSLISYVEWLWIYKLLESSTPAQKYCSELEIQTAKIWEHRLYGKKKKRKSTS